MTDERHVNWLVRRWGLALSAALWFLIAVLLAGLWLWTFLEPEPGW
jgi:polyferredoxin